MRTVAFLLAGLLLVVALSGAAGAEVQYRGQSPTPTIIVPQLSCTTVYDDFGPSNCFVEGNVVSVRTLRVDASIATAHVVLWDVTHKRQVVGADCASVCVYRFPATTGHFQLSVYSYSPMPGGVTHATLESDSTGLL